MNYLPTTVYVTSKDGVQFAVASDIGAAAFERAYAAGRTAAELEQNSDFVRVLEGSWLTPDTVQRALAVLEAAQVPGPVDINLAYKVEPKKPSWRDSAYVVQGGKA